MLDRGVVPGRLEGSLGKHDGEGEASNRNRAPPICSQFGFLAGDKRGQQTVAQSKIRWLEIRGLGRGHGGGERFRQFHPGCRQFERMPCRLNPADQFRIVQPGVSLQGAGGEPV